VTVLLYLDENVDRQVGLLLLALGFDVVFAREVHPPHTSDHIHLASATNSGRILVSHDRDYILLHGAWYDWFRECGQPPHPSHAGILLIPQRPVVSRSDAVAIEQTLLEGKTMESFANRLFDWTANDGWKELDIRN
jgi:uncharacterized protein DUF5615